MDPSQQLLPKFGEQEYTQSEKSAISSLLEQKLGADEVTFRTGAGNQSVGYLETWRAIELANEIFGYDGWSSSVINLSQDFCDGTDRVSVGISAVIRVQLKDGSFHEDVGYGLGEGKKGAALEKAKKEAISDGLKRALRLFGNHLGNSIYDKTHMKENQTTQSQQKKAAMAAAVKPAATAPGQVQNNNANLQQQQQRPPSANGLNVPQSINLSAYNTQSQQQRPPQAANVNAVNGGQQMVNANAMNGGQRLNVPNFGNGGNYGRSNANAPNGQEF